MSTIVNRPDKEIFEEIASIKKLGDPAYAEKDWFVTQIIKIISQIEIEGYSIAFTGGTALSKAYQLIERFSEDIDFVINSDKENTRSELSKFKKDLIKTLNNNGLYLKEEYIKAQNANQYILIEMDYETYFDRPQNLRSHIKIEFSIRKPRADLNYQSVSSFLSSISKTKSEVEKIACINPAEIGADKLSALTWRTNERYINPNYDQTIIRHLHDLAKLKELIINFPSFIELLKYSMENDISRSKDSNFKEKTLVEKLIDLCQRLKNESHYEKEYNNFVRAMSYALFEDQVPNFHNAILTLEELINKIVINAHNP